jgi:5'-methylthioinosine phosphorylase
VTRLAVIGGTGLSSLEGLSVEGEETMSTPWGDTSAPLVRGRYAGREVLFLARHGNPHVIPPHRVNYRANIHALAQAGVDTVIAVNAVGGISPAMAPGRLIIPDQVIDYTLGRGHTFFEDDLEEVVHVDFTLPYSETLRQLLVMAAEDGELDVVEDGTYGATQGPRLESAAEISRMEREGCDLVGMTGMPEAALARELGLDYAAICMVVNWAAGKAGEEITMDLIRANLEQCLEKVHVLLAAAIERIVSSE